MGVKGKLNIAEFEYDFDIDGGAIGEIALHSKDGKGVMPVGAVITRVTALVKEACTSAGSATIAWGEGVDKDGYSGATPAVANFTANAVFNGYENDAALLFDATGEYIKYHAVTSAATGELNLTIATAALTAGRIVFTVEYLVPGING